MKFLDHNASVEARIDDLIGHLKLEEKTAQLRYNAPAIERLGMPAYNWWNEALHGVARNGRATVFPQAIGLAATWNAALTETIASAISDEARAKHHFANRKGSHQQYQGLTFWTPNINIFRDPRWGRGQETWGEDPILTAELGCAFMHGLQGRDARYLKTAACAKHFAVHSGPEADRHTFDACPPKQDFWETYLPAFERLVDEGVEAVMPAYNRTYGEACAGSQLLLQDILREQWNFKGHVVSDCWAIMDFHANHKVTQTAEESAALALKMGTDLNCGSVYCSALDDAIKLGYCDESDVDRALRRLLRTRFKLGMFDPVDEVPYAQTPIEVVNCEAHRELAYESACDSIVLLKNKAQALPIATSTESLLIVGPNAASIEPMLGNYFGLTSQVSTVIEGIMGRIPEGIKADYRLGTGLTEASKNELHWAIGEAARCDYVIAAMGLSSALEGEEGDAILSDDKGDRERIELPECQVDFIRRIRERIDKDNAPTKLIVLLFGGCAMAIPEIDEMADAVLQAWYPGERGGEAIASVLWGDRSPAGRMPVTVPRSTDVLPPYDDYSMAGRTYRFMRNEDVLYPFGFGLNYGAVTYRNLQVAYSGTRLNIDLTLGNTSTTPTKEVVQIYLQLIGADSLKLIAFESVELAARAEQSISINIPSSSLTQVDSAGNKTPLTGEFTLFASAAAPIPRSRELGIEAILQTHLRL